MNRRQFYKKTVSGQAPPPPPIFTLSEEYKNSVCSQSYIGKKGYTIPKSAIDKSDEEQFRKELYVKPMLFGPNAPETTAFPVFRENANKYYLPRFYGISRYGTPDTSELQEGDDISVPFAKPLRDYQDKIIGIYMDYVKPEGSALHNGSGSGGILEVPCGRGKCLGKDTPILMYDGKIKMVQDIVVGDHIMGDDSTPRHVLTLARGKEMMYKVNTDIGNYIVNQSHILSLKTAYNKVIDISVDDYLSLPEKDSLYGYRIDPSILPTTLHHILNLAYRINLEKLQVDDYYGFEIDGNHRFVLGDFTVTHNTVMGLKIISLLQKKTLILVHKEFLMNQWIERIGEFLPSARVGKIQAAIFDIENKDIVIGMIQTLYDKEYPTGTFDSFGLTIVDEVHRIGSEQFSRTLFKTITPYMLGISATVDRKDKLTRVLYMFVGEKIYTEKRDNDDLVCVRAINYLSSDPTFNEVELDFRGNTKYSTMIVKLCEFGPRSDFIIRVVGDLLQESENQIMILCHNRSLLTYLYEAICHRKLASVGYYVGGMKQTNLQETEEKQIVLATYAMAAEALDIKTLATLVMVTPKTDITQSVGRILRVKHENPIIVDIIDQHDVFQNQWTQRKRFYKKCNYLIQQTDSRKYSNDWENSDIWKTVYEPKDSKTNDTYDDDKPQPKCLIDTTLFLE